MNQTQDFDTALTAFVAAYQAMCDKYMTEHFPTLPKDAISFTRGKRYVRIVGDRAVRCFIDVETGDILKAASFKAPAPNGVRGSIFAEDRGLSCMGPYGCNSRR